MQDYHWKMLYKHISTLKTTMSPSVSTLTTPSTFLIEINIHSCFTKGRFLHNICTGRGLIGFPSSGLSLRILIIL